MKKAFVIAKQHGLVEYLVSSGTSGTAGTAGTTGTAGTAGTASTSSNTGTDKMTLPTTTGTDRTKATVTTTAFPTIPARAPPPIKKTLGRTNSKSLKRKTPSKKNRSH